MKSEPKLKIGFVLDGGLDKPDGVQQYILTLGQYYLRQGHSVRYLVAGRVDESEKNAISLGRSIKVVSNGNLLSVPLLTKKKRLRRCLSQEKFDVLHVQVPYSPLLGERLIFLAGQKTAIIGTFHVVPRSSLLRVGSWLLGRWCYFSLKRFDAMLSVSVTAQAVAARYFNISSSVLPNVIDYNRFRRAHGLHQYDKTKVTVLFLGRLVDRKGCQVLIRAIERLHQSGQTSNLRVLICGDGPLKQALIEQVDRAGLSQIVEFKGFVSEADKPRYYASADIVVCPSSGGESFGIVLLEAMASGRATVLAGDNAGYRTVMSDQPELLFDPLDDELLAQKINLLAEQPQLRRTYADWAVAYSKQFDAEVIGRQLLNIYTKALLKRHRQ